MEEIKTLVKVEQIFSIILRIFNLLALLQLVVLCTIGIPREFLLFPLTYVISTTLLALDQEFGEQEKLSFYCKISENPIKYAKELKIVSTYEDEGLPVDLHRTAQFLVANYKSVQCNFSALKCLLFLNSITIKEKDVA